jgi:succinate dehydrogenase/fumarate reductase flavoprotein subunit
MHFDYPVVHADILIIGGGSAGVMAAIRAKEANPHQEVVVFEKGEIKYSGSIPRGMDALNIVAIPEIASPELYVESNRIACEGIMDEPVNYRMAKRSWPMMKKLESWGVFFPRDRNNQYEVLQVHPKGRFCVTMKEPELKVILARKALESGAKVFDRTMAVRLIKDGGRVAGAIGLNVRSGNVIVCSAKTVILSSGGTARFGLPDSGHLYGVYDFPGNTGDGYCLAYRAGAELSGFEYTLVYYIVKDINAPLLYITLTRGAHLVNAFDERRDKDHPSIRTMFKEHLDLAGPMRIKMNHLPEEKIHEIEDILFTTERPATERFYKGRGIDFRKGEIELWPTEVFLCGGHGLTGVRVNEKAETSVPGLYAAGDTALVARGHLSGAFVFGEIAAESATDFASGSGRVSLDREQVKAFLNEMERLLEQKTNPVAVEEFEYKVRRMINDYIRPPKNEYKLSQALRWMQRFRRELNEIVRVQDIHDLFKLFEVENIIQSATLSATASRERKESRWIPWHYRSDYPERNDREWLKHIVLSRGDAIDEIRISNSPIIHMERSTSDEH